jgi:hypothetical protein
LAHPQTPSSGFRSGTYPDVPGEVLGDHGGVLRQPRLDRLRLAVDVVPVPHHRNRSQPSMQVGQEPDHVLAVDVVVEEVEV